MNAKTILHGLRATALAVTATLVVSVPLQAQAATHGFSGGGHAFAGGHAMGGYRGGFGGYHGAYRGYGRYGHGWRGGYYGWRGGYGWGWWGWPAAGLFLATLPLYYSTLWWDGTPYYYADDNYYIWSNSANGYVSVVPPSQVMSQAQPAAPAGATYPGAPQGGTLFVYPKNGQAADQIAKDRQECQAWAGSQAGGGGSDNLRAQTACLEARGYSVK
jgi:hypothetical protein